MKLKPMQVFTLIALSAVLPATGYSFIPKQREPVKKEVALSPYYATITPEIDFMNLGYASATVDGASVATSISTFGVGGGFSLETGKKDLFRLKARGSLLNAPSTIEDYIRGDILDAEGQASLFVPLSSSLHFIVNLGWDYFWSRTRSYSTALQRHYTAAILRLNGPFAGIGFSAWVTRQACFEAGFSYHAPRGSGHINSISGSGWAMTNYRGGRSGLGGYFSASWAMNNQWTLGLQMRAKSLFAKGIVEGEKGAVKFMNCSVSAGYTF